MEKRYLRKIFAMLMTVLLIFSTSAQALAMESASTSSDAVTSDTSVTKQEDVVLKEQESDSAVLEQQENNSIVLEEQQNDSAILEEQQLEEQKLEEPLQSEQDEIAVKQTEVIKAVDFEQYYEENVKLIENYDIDESIDANNPYALRRIIGKMAEEVNLENYGADVLVVGPANSFILQFSDEETTEQAFLLLSQLQQLKYCELDKKMPDVEPVQEGDFIASEDENWNLNLLELDKYIPYVKEKVGSKSMTVCVLDTGVDATHSKLKARIKTGVKGASYKDKNGHGAHVAGILAKCTEGLDIKILPIAGIGEWSLAINGTKLAVSKDAKVINMSFGTDYSAFEYPVYVGCDEGFHDAMEMAVNAGVSVVVAAGNNGYTELEIDDYYECPAHFGVQDGIIAVANIDRYGERANDSGHGSAVDLCAPGECIESTYPGNDHAVMCGTSMAAPHISAIVAMMRLVYPEKTPAEIENLLKSYCKDLGEKGRDNYFGQGVPKMSLAMYDMEVLNGEHQWSEEYTVDKEATCTQSGVRSIHCVDCDMIKPGSVESIAPLGHNMVTVIKKATLTKSGTKKRMCDRCDYLESTKTVSYPKTITLSKTKYSYTGKEIKPSVTVKNAKGNVIDKANYTVEYLGSRIKAGTYTVKIEFIGKYFTGTAERTFKIVDNRSSQKISVKSFTKSYGSKAFSIGARLTKGNGKLKFSSSNEDVATISSKGVVTVKAVGKTTIKVTANETSKYKKATAKCTVTVLPRQSTVTSVKNTASKQLTIKWSKVNEATGYIVSYATNSRFTSAKSYTYKTNTTVKKVINSLRKGRKYYVRVRSYTTVDGQNYYSAWSPVRSITIKK